MSGPSVSNASFPVGLCSIRKFDVFSRIVLDFSSKLLFPFLTRNKISHQRFLSLQEPIGSVSPKVNAVDELNILRGAAGKTLSLMCPAQAYPTPVFRYNPRYHNSSIKSLKNPTSRVVSESCLNFLNFTSHSLFQSQSDQWLRRSTPAMI